MKTPPLKESYCRFYVVRHGETDFNVAMRIQGHTNSKLTDNGIEQAVRRSIDFKQIQFADVFSSDLIRAHHTAKLLAKEHQLAVKTTQLIRERSFGRFEGYTTEEYKKELAPLLQEYEAMLEEERFKHRIAGELESDAQIFDRFVRFFREAALSYPNKNVLVVSHGTIMRKFLIHLGYGTDQEFPSGSIKNLGYLILDTDGTDFFIQGTIGIEKTTPI